MTRCHLDFASPRCGWKDGMPGDPMRCGKTLADCREHGNEARFPAAVSMPEVVEDLPPGECRLPADLVVYRGRVKRLFLCAGHRHTYTGTGAVCEYGGDPYGPRRCGEAVER